MQKEHLFSSGPDWLGPGEWLLQGVPMLQDDFTGDLGCLRIWSVYSEIFSLGSRLFDGFVGTPYRIINVCQDRLLLLHIGMVFIQLPLTNFPSMNLQLGFFFTILVNCFLTI